MRTSRSASLAYRSLRLFPILGAVCAVASIAAASALEDSFSGARFFPSLSRACYSIPHHSAFAAIAPLCIFVSLLGNKRDAHSHGNLIRGIALWAAAVAIIIYALRWRDVSAVFLAGLLLAFAAAVARGFYLRSHVGAPTVKSQPAARAVVVGGREEAGPLVTLEQGGIRPTQLFLKRAMDIIGSLLLIIIASPAMLFIAAAVKLTSKGPVLFAHKRLGRNGKPLMVYKFRTMRADAEDILKRTPKLYAEYVGNNYKLPPERDFRITALGRFLRASSLDELPQLVNVLGGGMSLVGPRPIVPEEIVEYGSYGHILLSVKPGVTGQWQVSGRSAIRDYQQRVRIDLEYIRDQSLAKDLSILFRTMGAVKRMEGAY